MDTSKLESHIFRMYDSNGDGHIDFREFMIVLYVMSSGSPEENLKQVKKLREINFPNWKFHMRHPVECKI